MEIFPEHKSSWCFRVTHMSWKGACMFLDFSHFLFGFSRKEARSDCCNLSEILRNNQWEARNLDPALELERLWNVTTLGFRVEGWVMFHILHYCSVDSSPDIFLGMYCNSLQLSIWAIWFLSIWLSCKPSRRLNKRRGIDPSRVPPCLILVMPPT